MECVIPGSHVKVFAKAIHCLSKLGDEMYLEALGNKLVIRTVNSSQSAYACFTFNPSFFQRYYLAMENDDGSQAESQNALRCKLLSKSCLAVFKSLSTIARTVENCKLKLDPQECVLETKLYCHYAIVKTHRLDFEECETIQAVYARDNCANLLIASSLLMTEIVGNFQNGQEEVTLQASRETIKFTNLVGTTINEDPMLRTKLSLDPADFTLVKLENDEQITFCLKELRAIVGFGSYIEADVEVHFDEAGSPVVFSVRKEAYLEADFVLATLVERRDEGTPGSMGSTRRSTNTPSSNRKSQTWQSSMDTSHTPTTKAKSQDRSKSQDGASLPSPMDTSPATRPSTFRADMDNTPSQSYMQSHPLPSVGQTGDVSVAIDFGDDDDDEMVAAAENLDVIPASPPRSKRQKFMFADNDDEEESIDDGTLFVNDTDDDEL